MDSRKNKPRSKFRKLVIYEDRESGAIFLRPCYWKNGKFKLLDPSKGKVFSKFSAFNAELGKQVKKYLGRCN